MAQSLSFKTVNLLWVCLCLCNNTTGSHSPTWQDEARLQENLLKGYNKNLRPTFDRSQPTDIFLYFAIFSIRDFNEKTQLFSVSGAFMFSWTDESLVWNATEYNRLSSTMLYQNDLWIPYFLPTNAFSEVIPLGIGDDSESSLIFVLQNGTLYWITSGIFEASCNADVRYYPFDTQSCYIEYYSWFLPISEVRVNFFFYEKGITLIYFTKNGVWELLESNGTVVMVGYNHGFKLQFYLKRRSLFFLVNIVIPVMVIELLNILVFCIPAESGERVNFSVSVLLALSVFSTIISNNLPEKSEPHVPYICFFLLSDIITSVLISFTTIMGLRLHHKKESEPMHKIFKYIWLIYQTFFCQQKSYKGQIKKDLEDNICHLEDDIQIQPEKRIDNVTTHGFRRLQFDMGGIEAVKKEAEEEKKNSSEKMHVTWYNAACLFDIFSLVFFSFLFLLKNIIFILSVVQQI